MCADPRFPLPFAPLLLTAIASCTLGCAAQPNPAAIVATPVPADEPVVPASVGADAPLVVEPPASNSTAAGLPTYDIYLAALDLTTHPPSVAEVRNITTRAGYDNQPHFSGDSGKLLYTSIRDGQADIYAYDLAARTTAVFRHDPANEYSPTVMPERRGISMIREREGVQKLWHYSWAGDDLGDLLPGVAEVGYHAWLSANDVALFVLDVEHERHRLEIVHVPDGTRRVVAENIGRCLAPIPGESSPSGAISFVAKRGQPGGAAPTTTIVRYELSTQTTVDITPARPDSEDYAWTPDGSLLMAQGTALHHFNATSGWAMVTDLVRPGIAEITRLAVSADGRTLAFVAAPIASDP